MERDLSAIFKAYDIRGLYPDQLDEDAARRIGHAFAHFTQSHRVIVGRDMRLSSPALSRSFAEGVSSAGASVIDIGEVSTDACYFASGRLDLPAAMFTASHNPGRYNGIKPCRAGAVPIGSESGLVDIRKLAERSRVVEFDPPGVDRLDVLPEYAEHCRALIDETRLRPLKIAVDAGNGMAGKTFPVVFDPLPFEVFPLFFELDGSFPNHPANPIEADNLRDLQQAVLREGCDVGIAFDGDADRMFLVDDRAELISGSTTTALVAERLLKKFPGEKIIYNLICSWAVPEVIVENGGVPIRTRVGHSFIKQVMADTGAVFGGEHSGHYYFRDNFRADSGMIAALLVLEALSESDRRLSEIRKPLERYAASGEINSEVADQQEAIEMLAAEFAVGKQDRTDGLTVEFDDWWFNCRPSNTEPLLRLNLEARTREMMEERRDEVLALIRRGT
ncbi:MAG TPA: phosphomannomutase/phosphoglucomutase [Actinomycetota bacterium]|nr:phosphomannomutase/phosphoglucomutase [Actinomycetota bacterium]